MENTREEEVGKLSSYYQEFNNKYFGGALPTVKISLSDRLEKKAGMCRFVIGSVGLSPFELVLSSKYLRCYPKDFDSVLLHEMIHIKLCSTKHTGVFLEEVKRLYCLGKTVDLYAKSLGKLKYVYECISCGSVYLLSCELKDLNLYVCRKCFGDLRVIKKEGVI